MLCASLKSSFPSLFFSSSLAIRFSIAISSVLIQIQENRKGRGVICAMGEASVEHVEIKNMNSQARILSLFVFVQQTINLI